jgi:hypothetical protein
MKILNATMNDFIGDERMLNMAEDTIKNFKKVYMMLEDELSRELYVDRLNWLVSGDSRYVEAIVKMSHPDVPVWNRCEEKDFVNVLPNDRKLIFYGAGGVLGETYTVHKA